MTIDTIKLSLGNAVDYIAKGVHQELRNRIKAALMVTAEAVVDEAVDLLVKDLEMNLRQFYQPENQDVVVQLFINGVKKT